MYQSSMKHQTSRTIKSSDIIASDVQFNSKIRLPLTFAADLLGKSYLVIRLPQVQVPKLQLQSQASQTQLQEPTPITTNALHIITTLINAITTKQLIDYQLQIKKLTLLHHLTSDQAAILKHISQITTLDHLQSQQLNSSYIDMLTSIHNSIIAKHLYHKFAWRHNVGHNIIKNIELCIGNDDNILESYDGTFLNAAKKLFVSPKLMPSYNTMIGNIPSLTNYNRNIVPETNLTIPLHFWFCKSKKQSLPRAIWNGKLYINLHLHDWRDLAVMNWDYMQSYQMPNIIEIKLLSTHYATPCIDAILIKGYFLVPMLMRFNDTDGNIPIDGPVSWIVWYDTSNSNNSSLQSIVPSSHPNQSVIVTGNITTPSNLASTNYYYNIITARPFNGYTNKKNVYTKSFALHPLDYDNSIGVRCDIESIQLNTTETPTAATTAYAVIWKRISIKAKNKNANQDHQNNYYVRIDSVHHDAIDQCCRCHVASKPNHNNRD